VSGGTPVIFYPKPTSVRWWDSAGRGIRIGMTSTGEVQEWLARMEEYIGFGEPTNVVHLDFEWDVGVEVSAVVGYFPHQPKMAVEVRVDRIGISYEYDVTIEGVSKAMRKAKEITDWVLSNPVIKRHRTISELRRMHLIKECVKRDKTTAENEAKKAADPAFTKASAKRLLLRIKGACRIDNKRKEIRLVVRDGVDGGYTNGKTVYFQPQHGGRVDMCLNSYGSDRVAFKDILSDMQIRYSAGKTESSYLRDNAGSD
jgi:hypothetical protein